MENTTQKPEIQLSGQDGNIFNLIGIASKALRRAGQPDQAKEMTTKIFSSRSYDEAIQIIMEYCEVN